MGKWPQFGTLKGFHDSGVKLSLLELILVIHTVFASCRYGALRCDSDRSCWSGDANSTVPSNCKCCQGYPFVPGGECLRDCSANLDLYLMQLQRRLAAQHQPQCPQNGKTVNGFKQKAHRYI